MANETEYAAYGQFAWMYNSDPQVRALIDQASAEKWPAEKLAQAIKGTPWWQSMVESERRWNAQIADDPRSALEQRNRKAEEITKQAEQMGITLRPGVADSFADSFYRFGWSDIQLENSLLSQFTYEQGKTFGGAATIEQELTRAASDYGIKLESPSVQSWIVSIEQGRNTVDTFRAWAAQQAAVLYPWAKSGLETGLSVRDLAQPILQRVAAELEMVPEAINMTDTKWMRLLQSSRDKDGNFVQPAWADVEREIRNNPMYGWDRTTGARDVAAELTGHLAKTFGVVG